jgi:hypothetical protein
MKIKSENELINRFIFPQILERTGIKKIVILKYKKMRNGKFANLTTFFLYKRCHVGQTNSNWSNDN